MRQTYEMNQEQYEAIISACTPPPLIMLQCGPVRRMQERANDAWARLGAEMGFQHMTVKPAGTGPRFFTAEPDPAFVVYEMDGSQWCAHRREWGPSPFSKQGFGDTKEDALQELLENEAKPT